MGTTVLKEYPTSFFLGSDVVGSAKNMGKELDRYTPLLNHISVDPKHAVRQNLTHDNYVRLMTSLGKERRENMKREGLPVNLSLNSPGLILKPDYEFDESAHTGAVKDSFMDKNRP